MQYFSLEVELLLEPEWSTPKQIQEVPPARELCHIPLLGAASPAPLVGPLELVFTSEISISEIQIYRNFISVFLKLCFCFVSAFFFPFPSQPAHCRVNCRKEVMLSEKGMGFFFCFCPKIFLHGS